MTTNTLYYIHDPMCAWCYAFAPTFKEVKNNLPKNVEVLYVAGGLAPHTNEPMPMPMRKMIQSYWYQIEEVVGTKFNHDFWEKCTPRRSTYLSCQATLAAKNQDKEIEMLEAIQDAYYQRAMNPSDENTLVTLAQELNLDTKKFKDDLYSNETISEFKKMIKLRTTLNLNSFPSLALRYNGKTDQINIKYNDEKHIINQIKKLINNFYL